MNDDDLFYRIGKIAPKPGEILVLKSHERLTCSQHSTLKETLVSIFMRAGCPDQPVMILDGGLDLLVIDPRDFGEPKAKLEEVL